MTSPGLIAGRYRLLNRIATGGMGTVWHAWDELLHRQVAIKQLLLQPSSNIEDAELARRRVIREARITARLHHPHAVALYDVVQHQGQPCLIMQYVPARNLNQVLKEKGVLEESAVARIGAELASALAAAHDVGIVHRDVKPSNVLITEDGSAKLTDFGISHAAGDVTLTSTGMITGTPAFLAPEVARGQESGFPADVFSLGATMYAALEGTPPFGFLENPMALLHRVGSGRITAPRGGGALTAIVVQMLEIEPSARPSMADVVRLLSSGPAAGNLNLPAAEVMTVDLPPRTVRAWPSDHRGSTAAGPVALGSVSAPRGPLPPPGRRWAVGVLVAVGAVFTAIAILAGYLVLVNDNNARSANSATSSNRATENAGHPSPSTGPAQQTFTSNAAPALPEPTVATTSRANRPGPVAEDSTLPPSKRIDGSRSPSTPAPERTTQARTRASSTSARATSTKRVPPTRTTTPSATSLSGVAPSSPTAAELAGAITDYYAVMPADTDQGWDMLTAKFQSSTAHDRQYYQRFWERIDRVTTEEVSGAEPDAAQATITYYFNDGRISEERTAYTLVQQDGMLKIDTSTVLSSVSR
jgi:serine/threonine protein kinase